MPSRQTARPPNNRHHPNIIQTIASVCNGYLGLLVLPMCGADLPSCIQSGLISYSSLWLLASDILSTLSCMRSQACCNLDMRFQTCTAYDPRMRNKQATVFTGHPRLMIVEGMTGTKLTSMRRRDNLIFEASCRFTPTELCEGGLRGGKDDVSRDDPATAAVMLKCLRLALPPTAV